MIKCLINYIKSKFKHKHKWQTRGINRYGIDTYRICIKCKESQHRINKSYESELWEKCEPITELDNQFDKNNNFIF